MLHLLDDLWLDKMIPKNNDRNIENKINTLYWSVENSDCNVQTQYPNVFPLNTRVIKLPSQYSV
jgi:hypothetical protein